MSRLSRRFASLFVTLLTLGMTIPALSYAVDDGGVGVVARLEMRANDLADQIHRTPLKGGASNRARLHRQSRRVQREIARLDRGGPVDMAPVTALLGRERKGADPASLTKSAITRRAALERQLAIGPKLGMNGRRSIQEDIDRLDEMISAHEAGHALDVATLDQVPGTHFSDSSRSSSRGPHEHRVRLESLRRHPTGHKTGVVERNRIRHEIADLKTSIARMENEPAR